MYYYNGELYHHGIKGQKKGIRNAVWYPIDAYKRHLQRVGQGKYVKFSTATGVLTGAIAGGFTGSMITPGVGSIVGAVLGAGIGGGSGFVEGLVQRRIAADMIDYLNDWKNTSANTLVKETETKSKISEIETEVKRDYGKEVIKTSDSDNSLQSFYDTEDFIKQLTEGVYQKAEEQRRNNTKNK